MPEHPTPPLALRMQYIGACSLLGRLSARIEDSTDKACILDALTDCANLFPGQFEIVPTMGDGDSLEPIL